MAGRHIPIPRSKCRILLFGLSSLLLLLCLSSHSQLQVASPNTINNLKLNLNVDVETSFVASLEHFLTHKAPKSPSPSLPDDTVTVTVTREEVTKLDNAMYHTQMDRLYTVTVTDAYYPIRVYVYNMPTKFTYDLLWLFRNNYKDTSNLTSNGSPVHRLIEQHSIDYWLWADLIAPQSQRFLKSVVRVHRQEEADLFYIPFFTTISFFLLEKQQCKALYRVKL